ncbi:MAG: hypothetical protein AAGG69_00655 [Pseudomonadota bacterium]
MTYKENPNPSGQANQGAGNTAAKEQATAPIEVLAKAINSNRTAPKDVRAAFSKISDDQRPWQQLLSSVKQAARNDARDVIKDGGIAAVDELVEAGYTRNTAQLLARDIGLSG